MWKSMSAKPVEKKFPEKLKFIYQTDEDCRQIYVNGAYGGMTPKGELIINFFFERTMVPKEERMPVVDGKPQLDKAVRVDPVTHDPTELVMIRNIKATIIIPVQEIATIANWMIDRLKESRIVVEKEE
jgi:hypothetical protein